jgi:hypothetical protein
VDADRFKDSLLLREQADGTLNQFLGHTLSDEREVSVRELSGFVHAESTTIANTMRDRCLAEGENIIIHGTLSSTDHTDELLQQLDLYGYANLVIFDIEVSVDRAIDQALGRWWDDRISNPDGLGGRFVSPDTVRRQYSAGELVSNCAKNAQILHDRADSLGWNVDLQTIHSSS